MFPPGDVKKDAKGDADSAGEHKFDLPKYKFEFDSKRSDLELTPSEYFERVAMEDKRQNRRLSLTLGTSGGYKLHQKRNRMTRLRFVVCSLGLLGLAISVMSRMILNLTITQMVETEPQPTFAVSDVAVTNDGSCPWPVEQVVEEVCESFIGGAANSEPNDNSTPLIDIISDMSINDNSQSATTEEALGNSDEFAGRIQVDLDEMNSETSLSTTTPLPATTNLTFNRYPQYKWSIQQQNVLLGSFFYSYSIFMVVGGRLAEMYGAKYVLMLAVGGSALISLATPWMAEISFGLLVMSRILMGAIQAGVVPAMYALFAKWLTMTEASIFVPMIKMNLRLGMLMGSSLPGLITGWPNVFYLTGLLSFGWSLVWFFLATSDPADNGWVSRLELERIVRKKRKATAAVSSDDIKPEPKRTPWFKILTSPSVVALIIVKLTFNYGIDFVAIELPSYLKYVHHASKEQISAITSVLFLIQVTLIVFIGWMAKVAIQRKPFGMSKTGVRKLFQGAASFGVGASYLLLTLNNCNLLYVAVMFNLSSFASMFGSGGESMLPYDLSDEYPATIMAIANSFANLSAIVTTTSAALVLGDEKASFARWNLLLMLVGAVNLVGGLAFTLMVKAEPIDFGSSSDKEKCPDLEANPSEKQKAKQTR